MTGWEIKGNHESGLVTVSVVSERAFGSRVHFGSTAYLNQPHPIERVRITVPIGSKDQTPSIVGYIEATESSIRVSRWPDYRRSDTSLSILVRNELVAHHPISSAMLVDPEISVAEPALEIRVDTPGKPGNAAAALHLHHKCLNASRLRTGPSYPLELRITKSHQRELIAAIYELHLDTGEVPSMKAIADLLGVTTQTIKNHAVETIADLGAQDPGRGRPQVIYEACRGNSIISDWQTRYFPGRG